ncbi:hypothetical protein RIF29_26753 [Crotalaria pallida]|uniref:Uncharacterized protein n=1 Tax=Crotalaria pallida TaxID=3830 RepID=A0AAN9EP02_CROPI
MTTIWVWSNRASFANPNLIPSKVRVKHMTRNIPTDSTNNARKKLADYCLCGGFKSIAIVDNCGMEKEKPFVDESPPPGLESLLSQDFIHFESRKSVYKQLLEAMEGNYMTGLHGIRGIGKTTLAKEVGAKLHESIKFDNVIYVTMSENSHISEIQDDIARQLELSLEGKNEWERMEIVKKRLMNGKRFLLILDDVMENVTLEELGIPSRDNNLKGRVLVTSCDKRLCKSMGCQRSIQLDKLPKRDAWILFKKHVGTNGHEDKGKQISKACEGLPGKIVLTASILKGRPLEDWEKTLTFLRNHKHYDEGSMKSYAFFHFSHDNSNIEKAQRLSFLLFMLPQNTPLEMLTRLGTGLGLFREVEKYHEVRSEVLKIKNILIDNHICFEDDKGDVKMNDWVKFTGIYRVTADMPEYKCHLVKKGKNIRYCYESRVKKKEINDLPHLNPFDYYHLEMLLINIEANISFKILKAFFEKMRRLRVLSLSSNNLHRKVALKLPSSLWSLKNIRSLILCHWKLGDISSLEELKGLDTLDFDDCSIYELPKGISRLKLRLLSLERCQIKKNNPFEVIERCLSLQELYYKDNDVLILHDVNEREEIYRSGTFPTLNRYHLQGGEDSISKCVCLPSIDALISESTFKYLTQGAEILQLKEIEGRWTNLIPDLVSSMDHLFKLSLESCLKMECLVNTKHIESHAISFFPRLVELKLVDMDNLKELCSGDVPSDYLESLKMLYIEHCAHLQGVLFKIKVNLCNLKSMNLFDCREITSLFQLSTALSLALLEELRIRDCKLLANIIEDENECKSNGVIFPKLKTLEIESCDRLECILPLAFPIDVPLLKNIKISKCPMVKHIFREELHVSCSLQKVELSDLSNFFNISIERYSILTTSVKVSSPRVGLKTKQQELSNVRRHKFRSASKIKISVNDALTDDQISSISTSEHRHPVERTQCPPKQSPGLNILVVCNLKHLELRCIEKIKYLFTLSTASSMMLEILIIESCHELKNIIEIEEGGDGKNFNVVFSKLKELSVSSCDKLEYMFGEYLQDDQNYNDIHIHLPALEKLILQNLPMFSLSSMTWPYLKEFTLIQCPEFIINSISDMMIHSDSRKMVSTIITDIREIDKQFLSLETLNIECIKVNSSSIFCLNRPELIGQVRFGLRCIKLRELPELLNIFVGSRNSFIFQNLKRIQLFDCHKLEVIFPASVVHYLPELEHLEIRYCSKLKQIIEEVEEDKTLRNNNLDFQQPRFPKLAVFMVEQCSELKHPIPIFDVPNLKIMQLIQNHNLEAIFPAISSSSAISCCLPELEHLETEANGLKQIIEVKELADKKLGNNNPKPCFPKLEVLVVKIEYDLKRLIPIFDIPKVKTVKINSCRVLEAIFPASSVSCLPELELLSIEWCEGLKQIIEVEDNDDKILANEPCFPKLTVLHVDHCHKLKHLFSAATYNDVPNLEALIIIACEGLKELMGGFSSSLASLLVDKFNLVKKKLEGDVSMEKMNVELKLVMFIDLPSLCYEGIDALQNIVRHRFVYKCPKLKLTSTVTFREIEAKVLELYKDLDINWSSIREYSYPGIDDTKVGNSDEEVKTEFPLGAEAQTASGSDLPSSSQQFMEVNSSPAPSNLTQVNEESQKESVGKVPDSKIPTTSSNLPTHVDRIENPSLSSPTHITHLHEMVYGQSVSEPCLIKQQKPIGETHESTIEIPQSTVRDAEEGTTSDNTKIVTWSTNSESAGSESYLHTSTDKDSEGHKINIKDSSAVDEDDHGQLHIPSVSDVEVDNLVGKVLADLEESLKKPLKEIACTAANNQYHLLAALKFLSNFASKFVTLSDGLQAVIVSMDKEFPTILSSFKQVLATINKLSVLESHLNEASTKLVLKISDAKKKDATLRQQIIRLGKQIEDPETEISSLEEEHKKCIAEITGYEKEYENAKKDKSKMVEDQRKAWKELFEMEYRWSALCSKFEFSHLLARNPS